MSANDPESDTKPKGAGGRPTLYCEEMLDEICFRLFEGETLTDICRDESMPDRRTVWTWTRSHPEFLDAYARARKMRAYSLSDRHLTLGRMAITFANGAPGTGEAGARVQAVKLEMDALRFEMSKANPSEFADTIKQEISGPNGGPISTEAKERSTEDEKRFAELLAAADKGARPNVSTD